MSIFRGLERLEMGFISEGASQVGCVDEVHTRRLQPLSRTPATWASLKQAVCFTHSERSSRRKMPSNVSALLLLNCPPRFPSPSAASSSPRATPRPGLAAVHGLPLPSFLLAAFLSFSPLSPLSSSFPTFLLLGPGSLRSHTRTDKRRRV